jgi:hypothetical protein
MTLQMLLAELRKVHGKPDLKVQLTWDGGAQWSAVIPGYLSIDSATKSITSGMAMGPTLRSTLENMIAQLKGRTIQVKDSKDAAPFAVPASLTLGTVEF